MTRPERDEPAPLPDAALRLLADYVVARAMPADAHDRVARVVLARPRPSPLRVVVIGVLAAAAIVVVLVGRDAWVRRASEGQAPRGHELAPDRALDPEDTARTSPAVPVPAELPVPSTTPAPADRERTARPPTTRVPRSRPAATPVPSTLAAERELLAGAWQALTEGDAVRALRIAEDHRRGFVDGVLVPERDAIAAIARCRTAMTARTATADAFARAHPGSVLLPRVREACGGDR